jgi:hypothetical protein
MRSDSALAKWWTVAQVEAEVETTMNGSVTSISRKTRLIGRRGWRIAPMA